MCECAANSVWSICSRCGWQQHWEGTVTLLHIWRAWWEGNGNFQTLIHHGRGGAPLSETGSAQMDRQEKICHYPCQLQAWLIHSALQSEWQIIHMHILLMCIEHITACVIHTVTGMSEERRGTFATFYSNTVWLTKERSPSTNLHQSTGLIQKYIPIQMNNPSWIEECHWGGCAPVSMLQFHL